MSATNVKRLVVNLTTQPGDDRSSVAFTVANAALAQGFEVAVFLSSDGVELSRDGACEFDHSQPLRPLADLIESFTDNGGNACTVGIAGLAGSRFAWPVMFGGGALIGGALLVMSVAPTFAIAIVAMLMLGAGTGMFQMLNNALVMQEAEPAFYGRVMSLTMLAWGFNGLVGLLLEKLKRFDALFKRKIVTVLMRCFCGPALPSSHDNWPRLCGTQKFGENPNASVTRIVFRFHRLRNDSLERCNANCSLRSPTTANSAYG